ncbi:MAG: O-antigen ligase family protein [Candidatus Rokubacteria bacterium]|nr:O-antigen ligase family protein [Candidatus Rokubacteria bacterium]
MIIVRRALLGAFVLGLGFSITLSQSALAALTLLWLWRLRDPTVRARQTWPLVGPLCAFAAATLLSAALSAEPGASLAASRGLLMGAALWVTADAVAGDAAAQRFLSALTLVAAAAACMGLVQVLACPGEPSSPGLLRWFFHRCDRARGAFSIYMTLAGVLNVVLLAALPRLLVGPGRAWRGLAWLAMLLGLGATYTRGAWLGFALGVMAVVALARRRRLVVAAALLAVAAIAALAPGPLGYRLRSMGDPAEAGVKERRYMWQSGIRMWAERPWLGVGPGGVKRRYAEFALPEAFKKRTGHVHNTPLQILVERGVLGLAAWLWIWVAFFVRAAGLLRARPRDDHAGRALVLGSMAAAVGFLGAGLSEYNFGDSEVTLVMCALMALPFAAARPGPDTPGGAR